MRILLDACVDWRLGRDIAGHEVRTAHDEGWGALRNGELLSLAAREIDAFVTVDRNLAFQQHVPALGIAGIVLRCRTNRLADLRPLIPELLAALPSAGTGTVTWIGV